MEVVIVKLLGFRCSGNVAGWMLDAGRELMGRSLRASVISSSRRKTAFNALYSMETHGRQRTLAFVFSLTMRLPFSQINGKSALLFLFSSCSANASVMTTLPS
jgi:hypothetical protein